MQYFETVFLNSVISKETKYSIINSIINKLCRLTDSDNGNLRGEILLLAAKKYVLENESEEDRNKIMQIIVNNLFAKRIFQKNKCYISVIAQLFRGLYFYCIYEKETLSKAYRDQLAYILHYSQGSGHKL